MSTLQHTSFHNLTVFSVSSRELDKHDKSEDEESRNKIGDKRSCKEEEEETEGEAERGERKQENWTHIKLVRVRQH